jgi:hypothetical protein
VESEDATAIRDVVNAATGGDVVLDRGNKIIQIGKVSIRLVGRQIRSFD